MSSEVSDPNNNSLNKLLHRGLFRLLHGNKLVYNATWEDPRIDRELLQLGPESRVVTITSAGCNVLDMLLDQPDAIHAIDVNPRQNALLELKTALIRAGDFTDFFHFFGIGSHPAYREVYSKIRNLLSRESAEYWDKKISMFNPRAVRRSFYWHGTSGLVAWIVNSCAEWIGVNLGCVSPALFECRNLDDQRLIFSVIEKNFLNGRMNALMRHPAIMSCLGVPPEQTRLINETHPGGLGSFLTDKLRHVFMNLPISENYFWRVYALGSYSLDCCPNYLKRESFEKLGALSSRISRHTSTISEFLRQNPGTYSHFILLDHQDWLAGFAPAALREEWELIFSNSRPGTKVLLRSAGITLDFIPEDIRARLKWRPDLTEPLHSKDRVGTYGSLHMGEIR